MARISDRGLENGEIILDILTEVLESGSSVHPVLNQALQKHQYLDKPDHASITRVTEGTLEYPLQTGHVINRYSKTKTEKMKPLIRNPLGISIYRILYMGRVLGSAVCNEAVKLMVKWRFSGLRGFVNDVLRTISREKDSLVFDTPSLAYSTPQWMYDMREKEHGREKAGAIVASFLRDGSTWVHCNFSGAFREEIPESLASQGVTVAGPSWLESMISTSGYGYLKSLESFRNGWTQAQDVISALVSELADPKEGDYIIDVCTAPGGRSLHLAGKLKGTGMVEVRDLNGQKVIMIEENIVRFGASNIKAAVWDTLVTGEDARGKADIVIADLPCSGLGIIGEKPNTKYNITTEKMAGLASLQREVLAALRKYMKPGGILVYSIRAIDTKENEENARWFLSRSPLEPVDLTSRVGNVFGEPPLKEGVIQFLSGIHSFDGFLINVFR